MSLSPDTQLIQGKLATYCRDGNEVELPGTTPGRVHYYRRLVFNVVNDTLELAFPILHEFLEEEVWEELVDNFFSSHACQSYQVWKLPNEFYDFLVEKKYKESLDLPLFEDLLLFEWKEIEIYNMEDIEPESYQQVGDLAQDVLVFNPEFELIKLEYPVHLHTPDIAQNKKGNYFILLYREEKTGNVQFVDLSMWFALVIEQVYYNELPIQNLLEHASTLFGNVDIQDLKVKTLDFIRHMRNRGFVLGFKVNKED